MSGCFLHVSPDVDRCRKRGHSEVEDSPRAAEAHPERRDIRLSSIIALRKEIEDRTQPGELPRKQRRPCTYRTQFVVSKWVFRTPPCYKMMNLKDIKKNKKIEQRSSLQMIYVIISVLYQSAN